jgi:hypothetical protein
VLSEAVAQYRALWSRNAEGFQIELARTLYRLGAVLDGLGVRVAASEAIVEALALCPALAQRGGEGFGEPAAATSAGGVAGGAVRQPRGLA